MNHSCSPYCRRSVFAEENFMGHFVCGACLLVFAMVGCVNLDGTTVTGGPGIEVDKNGDNSYRIGLADGGTASGSYIENRSPDAGAQNANFNISGEGSVG